VGEKDACRSPSAVGNILPAECARVVWQNPGEVSAAHNKRSRDVLIGPLDARYIDCPAGPPYDNAGLPPLYDR
jgi:hypothetical protein